MISDPVPHEELRDRVKVEIDFYAAKRTGCVRRPREKKFSLIGGLTGCCRVFAFVVSFAAKRNCPQGGNCGARASPFAQRAEIGPALDIIPLRVLPEPDEGSIRFTSPSPAFTPWGGFCSCARHGPRDCEPLPSLTRQLRHAEFVVRTGCRDRLRSRAPCAAYRFALVRRRASLA